MKNLKKISKAKARTLFNNGQSVYLKASKLRLDYAVEVSPDWENSLDGAVNAYRYYNCNKECGMGVEYYEVA